MMGKAILAASFVSGAAVGIFASYKHAKNKYEKIFQEERDSLKEAYSKSGPCLISESAENINDVSSSGHNATWASSPIRTYLIENNFSETFKKLSEDFNKATNILSETGYSIPDDNADKEHPYVIPPEEFGEFGDYETISLSYYSDGVLADDNDEIVEDIPEVIGSDSLTHFGEFEDDSVYVRNDKLKADYEILRDYRKYEDVIKKKPYRSEEK